MNNRSALMSVLIAGVAMALLGNLPLINLFNCIVCLWVWLGGAAAVFLYRRYEGGELNLTPGQGAALGALSGVVGAVLGAGVYAAVSSISAPIMEGALRTLQIQGDFPFGQQPAGGSIYGMLIWFAIDLVLYPLFGALAGFITVNTMKGRAAPTTN